jgi:hypothetical protein
MALALIHPEISCGFCGAASGPDVVGVPGGEGICLTCCLAVQEIVWKRRRDLSAPICVQLPHQPMQQRAEGLPSPGPNATLLSEHTVHAQKHAQEPPT